MRTIDFNEVLSSVVNLEPIPGKEYATKADFEENIFTSASDLEAVDAFEKYFKPTNTNLFKLVLGGGTYKRAYGPGIFRTDATDDQPAKIVCISGENSWEVDVSGTNFILNGLDGDLSNIVINGQEYPSVEFCTPDDAYSFNVPFRTQAKEDGTHYEKNEIKSLLKNKKIDEFLAILMPVPKNRGIFVKIAELAPCEISLVSIEKAPKGQYGEEWYLFLPDGYYTKSNKKLAEQLSKGAEKFNDALTSGKPYSLVLGEPKFTSQGNKFCDAVIYPRKPNEMKVSAYFTKPETEEPPF